MAISGQYHYGDNDLIDLSEIHMKVMQFGQIEKFDEHDMHLAVYVIWEKLNFDENTDAFGVKTEFNNYSLNFQSKHRKYWIICLNNRVCISAYRNKD